MCDHEDRNGSPLSFEQFVGLLQQPPHEPCESELQFLTPVEYDAAFTTAMRLYNRLIKSIIARIIEDYDVAKDLAQDVFVSLYKKGTSFDRPYIIRAAKNVAYSELRRRRRLAHVLRLAEVGGKYERRKSKDFDAPDTRPLQDMEMFRRARETALNTAVEILDEKFRTPLMLLVEGESYARIMEITQTKEGTVKSRICRGKRILKRKLRAYLADGAFWQ